MPQRPVIVIHGWNDEKSSFVPLVNFLRDDLGFNVVDLWLGDYFSTRDEVTLPDIGHAMQKALVREGIPQEPHSFDVVIHSTGALVVREYLKQTLSHGDVSKTPIRHFVMLAPANYGSPLAKIGKSMLGRLFMGWKWKGERNAILETGEGVLDALELGSPYSYQLGSMEFFERNYRLYHPRNIIATVLVGTSPYDSRLKSAIHESGSDGTVRVSSANLNLTKAYLDFTDPKNPKFELDRQNVDSIPLAVLDHSHGSITRPDPEHHQFEVWKELLKNALMIEESEYVAHRQRCREASRGTYRLLREKAGRSEKKRENAHQFMNVTFYVHDQYGEPVEDYYIEFYQEEGDNEDEVFAKLSGDIIEKVRINEKSSAYRNLLFDTTDLRSYLRRNPDTEVRMSIVAAELSDRVFYDNPDDEPAAGIVVFKQGFTDLLKDNQTLLVDVTMKRETKESVFTLEQTNAGNP